MDAGRNEPSLEMDWSWHMLLAQQ